MERLHNKPYFSATISAATGSLAMAFPQQLGILVFIFLVPLFVYFLCIPEQSKYKNSFFVTLFFAAIFFIGSTLWAISAYPFDWLGITSPSLSIFLLLLVWFLFVVSLSLPLALFGPFFLKIKTGITFIDALCVASVWVILEHLRSLTVALGVYGDETLFGPHHTYYSLGYLFAHIPIFKSVLSLGGLYLASFVAVFVGYFVASLYCRKIIFSNKKYGSFLVCIFIFFIIGDIYLKNISASDVKMEKISITVVATNISAPPSSRLVTYKNSLASTFLSSYKKRSDIIVFPENFNVLNSSQSASVVTTEAAIVGSYSGEHSYIKYVANPSGSVEFSTKQLLMPLGEYHLKIVDIFSKFFNGEWSPLYKNLERSARKYSHSNVFFLNNLGASFSVALCSENISPYLYGNAKRQGAQFFLTLSSLAPFHDSALLARQTRAIGTVRALEYGRYFVYASNVSESFVVDDRGVLISELKTDKEMDSFDVMVLPKNYKTPYGKYGDYILIVAIMILAIRFLWISSNQKPING